ncbi:hypothetical protein Tco_0228580 [Tanacetum coccineum]
MQKHFTRGIPIALKYDPLQFESSLTPDLLKPLDSYSRSFSSRREVKRNLRNYTKNDRLKHSRNNASEKHELIDKYNRKSKLSKMPECVDERVARLLFDSDTWRKTKRYTQRFLELALLCGRMFPEESDKIKKYVSGFPDMIHGSVVVSKPKTMQEAVEIATELMDKKIRTFAERQTESKRKQEDNQQQQQQQQQQNKRQNTGKAYTTGAGEKKQYGGLNPYAQNATITTMVHDGPRL